MLIHKIIIVKSYLRCTFQNKCVCVCVILQVLYLLQSVYGYPQRNRAAGLVQRLLHFLLRHPAAVHRSGRKLWENTPDFSFILNILCLCFLCVEILPVCLINVMFQNASSGNQPWFWRTYAKTRHQQYFLFWSAIRSQVQFSGQITAVQYVWVKCPWARKWSIYASWVVFKVMERLSTN